MTFPLKYFFFRLENWSRISLEAAGGPGLPADVTLPDFPIIPASKGFCLTLARALEAFKAALASALPQGQ
jgi:hypothetical protein